MIAPSVALSHPKPSANSIVVESMLFHCRPIDDYRASAESVATPAAVESSPRRSVPAGSRRQRCALRAGSADSRRQWIRARLPGRASIPGRPGHRIFEGRTGSTGLWLPLRWRHRDRAPPEVYVFQARRPRSSRRVWLQHVNGSPAQEQVSYSFDIGRRVCRQRVAAVASVRTAPLQADAAAVFLDDASRRAVGRARTAVAAMTSGDTLKTWIARIDQLFAAPAVDTIAARRRVADAILDKRGYPF